MSIDDRLAVLSALLDREPVDPNAVAAAIELPEGRALLIDFARLRALTMDALDSQARIQTMPDARRRYPRTAWLKRAAVVLLPVLLTIGGAVVYERWEDTRPPAPDRVIEFTPGVDWNAAR
jgi:hypothetical protein